MIGASIVVDVIVIMLIRCHVVTVPYVLDTLPSRSAGSTDAASICSSAIAALSESRWCRISGSELL